MDFKSWFGLKGLDFMGLKVRRRFRYMESKVFKGGGDYLKKVSNYVIGKVYLSI